MKKSKTKRVSEFLNYFKNYKDSYFKTSNKIYNVFLINDNFIFLEGVDIIFKIKIDYIKKCQEFDFIDNDKAFNFIKDFCKQERKKIEKEMKDLKVLFTKENLSSKKLKL